MQGKIKVVDGYSLVLGGVIIGKLANASATPSKDHDIALRMKAAWNACEGIPTEALEAGVVKELIEVCEESLEDYKYQERETGIESNALKLLRAALAKAGGQS